MPKMGVLPTQAEVIELRERAPNSLESAAIQINRYLALAERAEGNAVSYRICAGHELIRVRPRIPHGEWEAWCAENIRRSQGDIRKLMQMAGSNDPEDALEQERAAGRERKALARANRADVRAVQDLFFEFLKLNDDQRMEFVRLVKEEMGKW